MVQLLSPVDLELDQIRELLGKYEADNPGTDSAIFRTSLGSIRLQVTNPRFRGKSLGERHDHVMAILDSLSDDVFQQLSTLICLAPGERMTFSLTEGVSLSNHILLNSSREAT